MLDFFDKTARKGTILTRKGYIIKKKDFSEKEILKIKNQLTVKPVVHRDFAHFAEEFPVFYESSDKLYLPRYWGLENLGPPKKIDICDGEPINLKCVFEPRPIQRPIIKRALSILQNPFDKFIVKSVKNKKSIVKHKLYGGGTIISVYCGMGKTYMALYIMTKLAQKTLIVVHTSVLLTQWIERIEQFVPGARVGIIKGPKCDVEDKDIVIAMLQTLVSENRVFPRGFFDQFGLSVVDECFPFNTSIITENGYSLIGTLYEMWVKGKEIPKILSYGCRVFTKMSFKSSSYRESLVKPIK